MSSATDKKKLEQGLNVSVSSKRKPRGAFTVAQLLSQVDPEEIAKLNASVKRFAEDKAGNEAL